MKLSTEAKFNLKNGFGSLISNRCALEAGKSMPWWSALIVALIGAFLPVIPIMTNIANTQGSSIITSTNYSFDRDSANALISYHNDGYSLIVDAETKQSTLKKNGEVIEAKTPELLYSNVITLADGKQQYSYRSYYLWDYDGKTIDNYFNNISNTQYIVGTLNEQTSSDPEGTTYYKPNIQIYYDKGLAISLYKFNTVTAAGSFTGDYNEVTFAKSANRDLFEQLASVDGMDIPATVKDNTPEYYKGVYNNYVTFLNESYATIKGRTFLYTTTIYYAIYVGLALFLGLLMFLLTRGKRNFNNYLKWYQCLSISGWCVFSPGLLAMILGFVLPNYAVMFFILLFGVRAMWMSMKQLSPTYQG